MYKPVDPKVNFPKMEEDIVRFWESADFREIDFPARRQAGVRILRRSPLRHRPPALRPLPPGTIKDIVPALQGRCAASRSSGASAGTAMGSRREPHPEGARLRLEDGHRALRHRQLQRGLQHIRLALREGMARDNDPGRALGRLRPRLQDDGPGLHGVHLVGSKEPVGQGSHLRGPLYPPLLSALLDRPLQPRARARRL